MAHPPPDPKQFDIRKLAEASRKPPVNDPWARAEQWRYTGPFTRANRFKGALPGLGTASVLFAIYLGYDYFIGGDGHQKEPKQDKAHH